MRIYQGRERLGISNAEMNALTENFYWKQEYEIPTYGQGELEKLMDRSADPTLDGEYSEGQTTAILVALATVGDERFAETLATRSHEVQGRRVKILPFHVEDIPTRSSKDAGNCRRNPRRRTRRAWATPTSPSVIDAHT